MFARSRPGENRLLAKVFSCAVVGLDGVLVEVEVDVGQGVPGMVVVGLPDAAVRESQDRVRAAIRNSGGRFPVGRVTVNLAPADLKKAGPTYDLPIALGILIASNQVAAVAAARRRARGRRALAGRRGAPHPRHHLDDLHRRRQGHAPRLRPRRRRGRGGAGRRGRDHPGADPGRSGEPPQRRGADRAPLPPTAPRPSRSTPGSISPR